MTSAIKRKKSPSATATKAKKEQKATAPWTAEKLNKLKLHELLSMALVDAKKQENTPGSDLRMVDTWLEMQKGKCVACLAGSMLRHTCGITPEILNVLHDEPESMPKWALAIDSLRKGLIDDALEHLNRMNCSKQDSTAVVEYEEDPEAWWTCMYGLLAYLKSNNF